MTPTLASTLPAPVVAQLRTLEGALVEEEAAVAPFTDTRDTCACGGAILVADEAVPDPIEDNLLHTPLLCILLDEEAGR